MGACVHFGAKSLLRDIRERGPHSPPGTVGDEIDRRAQRLRDEGIHAEFDRTRGAAIAKGGLTDNIEGFPCVAFGYAEAFEDRWEKPPD
jgi:hypothetical protein